MSRPPVKIGARKAGIAACAVALSLLASSSQAQTGPFAGLAGSWAGSGTIGMSNGTRERIRITQQAPSKPENAFTALT